MGVCVSFFAGEKQDQIGNIFSFLIPLGKLRLWGVWKDGYLLMAFLRSWLTCDFLLFSELCQHLPQKRALVWKLSTLADLPILDSFSSGQGYILFLFVSVGGGEKGGTEELLTASPCLDSSVAGSFLGFVLGEMTLLYRHLSYLGRWFSLPLAIWFGMAI